MGNDFETSLINRIPIVALTMDAEKVYQRRWVILGILSLSLIITFLNNVTLNVAIPELSEDLRVDNTEIQWIIDAYIIVFGGLLLVMGALGDKFGRKRALLLGLVIIGVVSGSTAQLADSSEDLILARGLMGVGAALVMPATLSLIVVIFPKEERGKAVGVWVAMAGIGNPLGLIVGGYLVEAYDWRWVFWINPPLTALAIVCAIALIPDSKDDNDIPLDPVGSVLSILALTSIMYAIIEAPELGWTSMETIGIGLCGICLLVVFIWWESSIDYPLLSMVFFRDSRFTMGLVAITLAFFVMFTFMFTQMLHFQYVRGHSPFEASLRFLPLPLGLMPAAVNSDRLCRKFGNNNVVSAGLALVSIGMLIFTTVEVDTPYFRLALIFMLLGAGMGLAMAPSTTLVMDSIPHDKAGVGSATNDTSRELGGAFGIAIGGSVLNEIYQSSLVVPDGLDGFSDQVTSSFPAAIGIGKELVLQGNPMGNQLIENANVAFMDGMTGSAVVLALVALINSIFVKLYMPRRSASGD